MSDASTERVKRYQYLCREARKYNWAWAGSAAAFITCIIEAGDTGFPGGWNWLLGAIAASLATLHCALIEARYHLEIALHILPDEIRRNRV